jgi:pimeloyl-ACP methyl ester carboxylesterase
VPNAIANGIDITYEEFGDPAAPVILLIMGLGAQLTMWREAFCRRLADAGFRVIRYDNRDVGLSTKLEAAGVPNMAENMRRVMAGQPVEAPYTLSDMARDAIGLLDTLAIARAHIVGVSMGGMIAQIVAATYPERVRSLVSIMSTSGRPDLPPATRAAVAALMSRPAARALSPTA